MSHKVAFRINYDRWLEVSEMIPGKTNQARLTYLVDYFIHQKKIQEQREKHREKMRKIVKRSQQ